MSGLTERERLEALIEQERLQEAIDIRSAIFEKYGSSIPCHIYKANKGINYSATLMMDDEQGTIFACMEVEKFDRMYAFFKRLMSTPSEDEIIAMQHAYEQSK